MTIMASSAAVCALGTEQLAVQSLYYDETPNGASAIFMLLSSQMLGQYDTSSLTEKADTLSRLRFPRVHEEAVCLSYQDGVAPPTAFGLALPNFAPGQGSCQKTLESLLDRLWLRHRMGTHP